MNEVFLSDASQTRPPRYRVWGRWALLGMAWAGLVAALLWGRAQLSLADEAMALQAIMAARQQEPELATLALLESPTDWSQMHRRVALEGFWLAQHTVLLEGLDAQGRSGVWVMTPLQLDASTAVWVQRGWIPRSSAFNGSWPAFETEGGVVRLQGRIAPELATTVTATPGSPPSASGSSKIRQNLSLAQFREETGVQMLAVVLQTDDPDPGLARELPRPEAQAAHYQGLAHQWFALAAVLATVCLWFHLFQPLLHARRSSS